MRPDTGVLKILLLATTAALAQISPVKISPFETGRCDASLRPVGIWNYYDEPDSLSLTLNFSSASLLYLKKDEGIEYVKTNISWQPLVVQRPARFVGSLHNLYAHYEKFHLSFRGPYIRNKLFPDVPEVVVWLSFEITPEGRAEHPAIKIEPAGYAPEMEASLITAFQNAPNLWLPAVSGSSEVTVKYTIPFIFCRGNCDDTSSHMQGKLSPYGKVLFTVPRFSVAKHINTAAVKNALPFTMPRRSVNQLEWAPDAHHIIFKKAIIRVSPSSADGKMTLMYRITESGKLIDTYLFTEDNHITCLSDDCSEFIVEFSGWPNPLLLVYRSQFGSMTYAGPTPVAGHVYNPDMKIAIVQEYSTGSGPLKLFRWSPVTNQMTEFSLKEDNVNFFSQPLNWIDENTLLCMAQTENQNQFFFLYNMHNETRAYLPITKVKFIHVSPFNKHDILVGIENDIPGLQGHLYLYNLETNQEVKLTPNKYYVNTAFFGSNEKQVFFASINNLYELDLQTRKIKKVLSGIYGVDIDPTRTKIVFRKTQDLYVFDIQSRKIKKIFTEKEHNFSIR